MPFDLKRLPNGIHVVGPAILHCVTNWPKVRDGLGSVCGEDVSSHEVSWRWTAFLLMSKRGKPSPSLGQTERASRPRSNSFLASVIQPEDAFECVERWRPLSR